MQGFNLPQQKNMTAPSLTEELPYPTQAALVSITPPMHCVPSNKRKQNMMADNSNYNGLHSLIQLYTQMLSHCRFASSKQARRTEQTSLSVEDHVQQLFGPSFTYSDSAGKGLTRDQYIGVLQSFFVQGVQVQVESIQIVDSAPGPTKTTTPTTTNMARSSNLTYINVQEVVQFPWCFTALKRVTQLTVDTEQGHKNGGGTIVEIQSTAESFPMADRIFFMHGSILSDLGTQYWFDKNSYVKENLSTTNYKKQKSEITWCDRE
jgi:hypothetical protein